jgi:hypothetical protein
MHIALALGAGVVLGGGLVYLAKKCPVVAREGPCPKCDSDTDEEHEGPAANSSGTSTVASTQKTRERHGVKLGY